ERQDGSLGAMGNRGGKESVPVVQVQGRGEGRQGHDHLDGQPRRQADRRSGDCMSLTRWPDGAFVAAAVGEANVRRSRTLSERTRAADTTTNGDKRTDEAVIA